MVPYDELYDTVRGLMASEYAVAGVENLFAEGSYCQRRYDDMRQAYARLCVRLGVEDEDRDLEQMISALDDITARLYHVRTRPPGGTSRSGVVALRREIPQKPPGRILRRGLCSYSRRFRLIFTPP